MIELEDQMRLLLLGLILYMAGMLVTAAINQHLKTTNWLQLGLRYLSNFNFFPLVYELLETFDVN